MMLSDAQLLWKWKPSSILKMHDKINREQNVARVEVERVQGVVNYGADTCSQSRLLLRGGRWILFRSKAKHNLKIIKHKNKIWPRQSMEIFCHNKMNKMYLFISALAYFCLWSLVWSSLFSHWFFMPDLFVCHKFYLVGEWVGESRWIPTWRW